MQLAARGPPALPRERDGRRDLGGRLVLHVERAAAPDAAVAQLARPRVVLSSRRGRRAPCRRATGSTSRGPSCSPAQTRDEVRALLGAAEQLDLEARASSRIPARYSWHSRSLPGGLTVLKRIRRWRSSAVSCCRSGIARQATRAAQAGEASHRRPYSPGDGPALRHRRAAARAHRRPGAEHAARRAHAPAHARRVRRPGARARPRLRAAHRDRGGAAALDGPLRAARHRARRRSPGSSPRPRAPRSRSSAPSRPGAPRCAR